MNSMEELLWGCALLGLSAGILIFGEINVIINPSIPHVSYALLMIGGVLYFIGAILALRGAEDYEMEKR